MWMLALTGGVSLFEQSNTSPVKALGAYLFAITKLWNEDEPARWPLFLRARG